MKINLFKTTLKEVEEKMNGTQWIDRNGNTRTVAKVYIDGYYGGYCVKWDDNSWNFVDSVLRNATQVL